MESQRVFEHNTCFSIVGSCIIKYEHYGSEGDIFWNGRIFFDNIEKPEDVTFWKIGVGVRAENRAKKLFQLNNSVCNERVMRPWFCTSCIYQGCGPDKQTSSSKVYNTICYKRVGMSLPEWFSQVKSGGEQDLMKTNMIGRDRILCEFWRKEIRELIVSVTKIHGYGCYHGSLNSKSSYVFVAGHLKLVNLEGSCSDISQDLYDFKKRQDFVDMGLLFRSLFALLTTNVQWPEKDAFLNCIMSTYRLGYDEFYLKLRKHPFLLTPMKRLEYADRLYRLMAADPGSNLLNILSSEKFYRYKNWNSKSAIASWSDYMQEVYFFKEKTDYTGDPEDLLRFIRNLFHHFSQVHCRPTVKVDEVDSDIRYFFEGFVDVIHRDLCLCFPVRLV